MKRKIFSVFAFILVLFSISINASAATGVNVVLKISVKWHSGKGNIGKELSYSCKVNGNKVESGTELTLNSGDKLTLYAKIVEDDDIDDIGEGKTAFSVTESNIKELLSGSTIKKIIDITVMENNGKHKGEYRVFRVTFTFEKAPISSELVQEKIDELKSITHSSDGSNNSSGTNSSKKNGGENNMAGYVFGVIGTIVVLILLFSIVNHIKNKDKYKLELIEEEIKQKERLEKQRVAYEQETAGNKSKVYNTNNASQNVRSERIRSAASSLARTTVMLVQFLKKTEDVKFLCASDVAESDTVFFSCFVLRALCITSTKNRAAAEEFTDAYITSIISMTKAQIMGGDVVSQMFNNRTAFYDRVIMKNGGLRDGMQAVIEQFDYILQSDYIDRKYVPYSESSPIPLIGITEAMQCRTEVCTFFDFLLSATDTEVKKVMAVLKM